MLIYELSVIYGTEYKEICMNSHTFPLQSVRRNMSTESNKQIAEVLVPFYCICVAMHSSSCWLSLCTRRLLARLANSASRSTYILGNVCSGIRKSNIFQGKLILLEQFIVNIGDPRL